MNKIKKERRWSVEKLIQFHFQLAMYEPKTLKETIKPLMVVNFIFGMGLTGIEADKPSKKLEYFYTICNLGILHFINKFTLPYYDKYYVISTFSLSRFIFQWMFHANIWMIALLIIITRIKAQVILNGLFQFLFSWICK